MGIGGVQKVMTDNWTLKFPRQSKARTGDGEVGNVALFTTGDIILKMGIQLKY